MVADGFLSRNSFNLVFLGEEREEVEGKVTGRIGLVLLLDYAITGRRTVEPTNPSPRLINGHVPSLDN